MFDFLCKCQKVALKLIEFSDMRLNKKQMTINITGMNVVCAGDDTGDMSLARAENHKIENA